MTVQIEGTGHGELFNAKCPTRVLLDRVGGKWTVMIVKLLEDGEELRFSELLRGASGISRKMLASSLRELERDGLLARRVEPTSPPSVYYRMTPLGTSLVLPLAHLRKWAEENMSAVTAARRHYDTSAPGTVSETVPPPTRSVNRTGAR